MKRLIGWFPLLFLFFVFVCCFVLFVYRLSSNQQVSFCCLCCRRRWQSDLLVTLHLFLCLFFPLSLHFCTLSLFLLFIVGALSSSSECNGTLTHTRTQYDTKGKAHQLMVTIVCSSLVVSIVLFASYRFSNDRCCCCCCCCRCFQYRCKRKKVGCSSASSLYFFICYFGSFSLQSFVCLLIDGW